MFRNVVLGVMILCAQFALASDAKAQDHEGYWYCSDCSFGNHSNPATPTVRTFIGITVNPSVDTWIDMPSMTPHFVTICTGSQCALYSYTAGGVFIQVGDAYFNFLDQDDYENSEEAPPNPTPPSGGGGGGGMVYYWSGGRLYGGGTCIYGCDPGGTVEVGEVDPQ